MSQKLAGMHAFVEETVSATTNLNFRRGGNFVVVYTGSNISSIAGPATATCSVQTYNIAIAEQSADIR